jgi:magnesium chelatase family protein
MLAKIISGATIGLDAVPIEVETDVASRGLPTLNIVGLPGKAVQEAKERVRSALQNSGSDYPAHRVTVNLAPSDLPKQGSAYDFPIALGVMIGNQEIKADFTDSILFGELSLDGSLRHTHGALPLTLMAKEQGFKKVYLPASNAREAAIVRGITIYPVKTIKQLILHLTGVQEIAPQPIVDIKELLKSSPVDIDMHDIHGQEQAKRALEIAAAGGHNIHLSGVPGAGKTMLSRAFAGILPHLTTDEALEITKIYSISGNLEPGESVVSSRPFRSPHHTTSKIGLIGGGSNPKPGEISLAHRGVLFLDEFPEFPRNIIESLRQPMEDGRVQITRANQSMSYPCRFTLIAASNPCPCGNLGSPKHNCLCTQSQINNYQKRISGPMLDRIDLHVTVPAVNIRKLTQEESQAEPSSIIQKRVQKARDCQTTRFNGINLTCNADMSTKHIKKYCLLDIKSRTFLAQATAKLGLTARSYFKTIKVARTIADLAGSVNIDLSHLAEALQYRPKTSPQL